MQKKKMLVRVLMAGLLASATCSAVVAQPPREGGRGQGERGPGGGGPRFGGGMGFGGGDGIAGVLGIQSVEEQLKLDDDQKKEIQEARQANQEEVRKIFGGQGGRRGEGGGPGRGGFNLSAEDTQKIQELRVKLDEKLPEILDPAQFKRAIGIFAQRDAVQSLSHPLVAKEIGISDEQVAKVKQVQEESGAKIREMMSNGGGFRGEGAAEQMREFRSETEKKALAVLSDEQKQKFEELKGEKFEFPAFGGRGPGGPGGRGPGGERGPRGDR